MGAETQIECLWREFIWWKWRVMNLWRRLIHPPSHRWCRAAVLRPPPPLKWRNLEEEKERQRGEKRRRRVREREKGDSYIKHIRGICAVQMGMDWKRKKKNKTQVVYRSKRSIDYAQNHHITNLWHWFHCSILTENINHIVINYNNHQSERNYTRSFKWFLP